MKNVGNEVRGDLKDTSKTFSKKIEIEEALFRLKVGIVGAL